MCCTPVFTPGTIVVGVAYRHAIRGPAFDVSKIIQDFVVLLYIATDEIVVLVEEIGVPAVGVSGHVDKGDVGVFAFKLGH